MSMSPSFVDKLKKLREEEKKAESNKAADKLTEETVLKRARVVADAVQMAEDIEGTGEFRVNNPSALRASFADYLLKRDGLSEEQARMLLKQKLDSLREKKIIEDI